MITAKEYQMLLGGCFAALWVDGPMKLDGYVASDPQAPGLLRLDGMTYVDYDSRSIGRFSVRLEQKQIAAVNFLVAPPHVPDKDGKLHPMTLGFWSDLQPTRLTRR